MDIEYLIFNALIFAGPLALSFDKKVHFYTHWRRFLSALWLPAMIFLIWDMMVTERHWWFNPDYTLAPEVTLFNLPTGEWLFFFTIPYACVFTWEVINAYFKDKLLSISFNRFFLYTILLAISGLGFMSGLEYTAITLFVFSVTFYLDHRLKTYLYRRVHFYRLVSILLLFTTLFNGYLTARPLVIYDYTYQLELLIFTIPIEDYLYGITLIYAVLILFERKKANEI